MEMKNIDVSKTRRAVRAFTLIELLVVIAIIGIVAALVTGLAGRANKIKKINRVRTELEQLDTVIESYKEKKGFYPPSNGDANNVATNQLFYELTGTFFNANDNTFEPINGSEKVSAAEVLNIFGVEGFANSSTEKGEIKNFFTTMKTSQSVIFSNNPDVQLLVVPVEGPNDILLSDGRKINTWRYNASNPTHNPESFDLWAELLIGGKTNIIGNWKE